MPTPPTTTAWFLEAVQAVSGRKRTVSVVAAATARSPDGLTLKLSEWSSMLRLRVTLLCLLRGVRAWLNVT